MTFSSGIGFLGSVSSSNFQGKIVFITGASSGIGEALAREFARRGACLVLTARRVDRLEKLAAELRAKGSRALVVACDVTRDGDVESAIQAAVQEFHRVDVVVANAGFGVTGLVEKLKIEDFRRQFETNVFGVLRTIYASLNELKKSRGSLVLLGSVAGYVALPGGAPYSMSKFSVHALAHAITPELHSHGVSVTLIAPGFIQSEIREIDNFGKRHPGEAEPLPDWLPMRTEKAAIHIVDAVAQRRVECVITAHGKLAVTVRRFFPGLLTWMMGRGLRNRKQPGQQA